jgi:hypothetical protein
VRWLGQAVATTACQRPLEQETKLYGAVSSNCMAALCTLQYQVWIVASTCKRWPLSCVPLSRMRAEDSSLCLGTVMAFEWPMSIIQVMCWKVVEAGGMVGHAQRPTYTHTPAMTRLLEAIKPPLRRY